MGESMVATKAGLEVSVSFGRFENDSSLSWEKWSSFSPNKYLEEVEKYATPGSVAEKKAYFEAHYKKIAARKAAELLEQQKQLEEKESNGCEMGGVDEFHVSNGESSDLGFMPELVIKQCELENDEEPSIDSEAQVSSVEEAEVGLNGSSVSPEVELEIPAVESQHAKESVVEEENVKLDRKPGRTDPVTKNEKVKLHQQKKVANRTSNVKDTPIAKTKKASPPAIQRPQNTVTTPRVSKPASATTGGTLSSSRMSTAKKVVNAKVATKSKSTPRGDTTKRVAPKSLHLSMNVDTPKSEPQPRALPVATSARKSLIMETMGDKDIVRRAFKTFQSSYNLSKSSPQESSSLGAKQVPSTRSEVQVANMKTPRKENGGNRPYKAGDADKRYAKAAPSSFGSKSDERSGKKEFLKKMEGKPNAKEAESARLRTKSKEDKDAEIKKLRQSLNFKATPLPSSYGRHKAIKSSFDKESSKTLQI
ncbi:Protein WVD2-like 7 [Linum perenne]